MYDGFDVLTLEDVVSEYDVFVTATGNFITADHMLKMRHNAIVCNIGHFDNEIDMAGLEAMEARGEVEKIEIKPQVHEWRFKTQHMVLKDVDILSSFWQKSLGQLGLQRDTHLYRVLLSQTKPSHKSKPTMLKPMVTLW